MMQWHRQSVNITTDLKVKVYFSLPVLSAANDVMWKCDVDKSVKGGYDMILGWYISIELGLNLKLSEHVIEADDRPFEGSTTLMVDLGTYVFKYLNTGKLHLNNRLLILRSKYYIIHNMYTQPLKNYFNIRCQIRKGRFT